jgi:hypothetical protein
LKTPPTDNTNEISDEREVIIGDDKKNKKKNFTSNHIRTAKYNIITFLPLGLLV